MKNYYEILSVSRHADTVAIKKAYRAASMFWHPDKCKHPYAHDKFIDINEAYNILIDPEKRRVFDELLAISEVQSIVENSTSFKGKQRAYEGWVSSEREKGEKMAKMSFDSFLTKTFQTIDEVHTGCSNVFGFFLGLLSFLLGLVFIYRSIVLITYAVLGNDGDFRWTNALWMLPVAPLLLILGDVLFYQPICEKIGIKKRWWRIPFFKHFND